MFFTWISTTRSSEAVPFSYTRAQIFVAFLSCLVPRELSKWTKLFESRIDHDISMAEGYLQGRN